MGRWFFLWPCRISFAAVSTTHWHFAASGSSSPFPGALSCTRCSIVWVGSHGPQLLATLLLGEPRCGQPGCVTSSPPGPWCSVPIGLLLPRSPDAGLHMVGTHLGLADRLCSDGSAGMPQVSVFGFGADSKGNWHHYWEENRWSGAFRRTRVHDADVEFSLIQRLAAEGRILFYQ